MFVRFSCRSAIGLILNLTAGAALAADMRMPALPVMAQADAGMWDGLYIGIHAGAGKGTSRWRDPQGYYALAPADVPARGAHEGLLAGVQAGYNMQFGSFVTGIEAGASGGTQIGYAPCGATVGVGGNGDACGTKSDVMAALTGKLGFAFGRSLVYAKAGAAYARLTASIDNQVVIPAPLASRTLNRLGWTAGIGIGHAIDANWSLFGEYAYQDFGARRFVYGSPAYDGSSKVGLNQHLVKVGLNFRSASGEIGAGDPASSISGEVGTRIGPSTGRFKKKLYDNVTPGQLNSMLTWPTGNDVALEAYGRADHDSGLFLRGTIGGLDLGASKMTDEDTAAAMAPFPYSNTQSTMKNGRGFHGSADLGYALLNTGQINLGPFVGYGFVQQRVNGYGCEQVAGSVVCAPAGSVSATALTLGETEMWQFLRLGAAGSVMLTDKLKLSAAAAWLGGGSLSARDNHWLRTNINPLDEKGRKAKGYEIEASASYAVTNRISLGLGARYIALKANGGVFFPGATTRSPEEFQSSRLTTFVQASYRFGAGDRSVPVMAKY